jgi:hypothetical protein
MNKKHDNRSQIQLSEPPDEPQEDWLTIGKAIFYFIPEYTGRGQQWVDTVMTKARRFIDNIKGWQFEPQDDEKLLFRAGSLDLTIRPEAESFSLYAAASTDTGLFEPIFEEQEYLYCSPQDFLRQCKTLHLKEEYLSDGEVLYKVGGILAIGFEWLDTAITDGEAMVMARKGSPFAPFSRIHSDQWRYFRMSEDIRALAEGPRGEKLFSVFIAPSPRRKFKKFIQSKISSKTACQRWLEQAMRGSPTFATSTKADLLAQAKKQWPDLSGRGFDDAWKSAISSTNAIGWVQPGPRPKSQR